MGNRPGGGRGIPRRSRYVHPLSSTAVRFCSPQHVFNTGKWHTISYILHEAMRNAHIPRRTYNARYKYHKQLGTHKRLVEFTAGVSAFFKTSPVVM